MIFALKTIMIQKNYEMYYRNINMENGYTWNIENWIIVRRILVTLGDELVQIFYQKKEQMFTSGTICAKI